MKKLVILKRNNYIYDLHDNQGNNYSANIEFVGLTNEVSAGDIIYMAEELLKEKQPYTFGPLNSDYGKKTDSASDSEYIILETKGDKIYLQRYYG